ncbi:DEAD/DEAH box helicase family protein [Bacteroidales bacterium OttesenSCG-928-I21]|nr:DEAD/DEAH box helicase family protein [Bacteroidales bacterium OttesenSCG-928-I21]
MLKDSIQWSPHRQYKSKTEWEPLGFFSECLCNSTSFDLMLGFFSSSAIRTLSDGFALFLYNGGTMRLIINNILSAQDKDAIIAGIKNNSTIPFDLTNIEQLQKTLSEKDRHFFECLSWLISNKRIEIQIISPKGSIGIAHTKSGVFSDGQNTVSFNGSCNFTKTALLDNIESIDVSCNWDDGVSEAKVKNTIDVFSKTFSKQDDTVKYIEPKDIISNIANTFGNREIEELLEQEERIFHSDTNESRPAIKKAIDKAKKKLKEEIKKNRTEQSKPKFPYPAGARPYQKQAFENWKNNKTEEFPSGQSGLFAMATGTGKTITSLNCLLEIYKKTGYYKALILVPTITLVNQWESECRKFNFNSITKVCSKNPNWKNEVGNILLQEKLLPAEQVSYIVIATYASFSRINIFSELNQLSAKTLLIADECHNMGSSALLKLLPKVNFKRRIGLSATPERQFDEEGTQKIYTFFNSGENYTYEFSMELAINGDREKEIDPVLCRYYYYPHLVSLTEEELDNYMKLSLQISTYYNSKNDSFKSDPILTALLLKRKRIIHKAFNKKSVFCNVLEQHYQEKGNLKYTLVYVPEGNDPNDYFETDIYSDKDEMETDSNTVHLIDVFTKAVRDIDERTTVRKFISGTNERDEILEQFAKGDIDVLTSMKCLDEGVDVPRAELAIFCASTGNPRQFIQRRGRILRKHEDKLFAYIHDLVVIPEVNPNSDSYKMEQSMLKKELERVNDFAKNSENKAYTVEVLLETMNHYKLNLYDNE